ncbi:MAG: glycine oxidase ThiO [Terriglobia bacterium]
MRGDDVVIVGGGLIGCSLALRLAEEKLRVTVVERGEPGQEASWAAAGMLAPTAEVVHAPGEAELAKASAALYPTWVQNLEERAKVEVGYRTEGTLLVAFDPKEASYLGALPGEPLTSEQARRLEPALSERVLGARLLPSDRQVDNRRLFEALLRAARGAGVRFQTGSRGRELLVASGRATGVQTAEGTRLEAGAVVNAAGCWASALEPGGARLTPTKPIRGQMVALRAAPGFLRHVVRSARAYIVPRARLLLGTTMEDVGYDKSVTPGGLRRILAGATEIVPALAERPFEAAWAGLRPDTPDHLPLLGPTDIENYFVATGHFRNGILLAPITAELLTETLLGRQPRLPLEPFSPLRFAHN